MMDVTHRMEAEDLADARETVQTILRDWDWLTWNELLADNVVLSLRLGAAGTNQAGRFGAVGGNLQVTGREEAKRLLHGIYGDLRSGLSVTTEIISGYDVTLLGTLAPRPMNENAEALFLPVVLYMAFGEDGKIEQMTIALADLNPLIEAVRAAARSSAAEAG
ncbi:MAG: hypothetical protein ACLP7P_16445 [Rhodomicrobium sp.]